MTPLSLRAALAFVAVFAIASPALSTDSGANSGGGSQAMVPAKDIPGITDPQLDALAKAATDPKLAEAVKLTKTYFDRSVKALPAGEEYARADVEVVGQDVNEVIGVLVKYQKAVEVAKKQDPKAAAKTLSDAMEPVMKTTAKLSANLQAMQHNAVPTPAAANQSAPPSNAPSAADKNAPGGGAAGKGQGDDKDKTAGPANIAPPAPPTSPPPCEGLCTVAVNAATQALVKVKDDSSGAQPGGADSNEAPGGGATPNGPAGENTPNYPTISQLVGLNNSNNPSEVMTSALDRYNAGDVSGALTDASRAVDLGGGAEALALRGGIELDQKNYAQANQDAGRALQLDSSNKQAQAVLHFSEVHGAVAAPMGLSFGASPAPGAAAGAPAASGGFASLLASILPSRSASADPRRDAANALRMNDAAGAAALATRALALDPNNPGLLNLRASAYARQGQYDKAVADAEAGLKLAPQNRALLVTKGYAQVRGGKSKDALETADGLLALNPDDAYAHALRAHAYGSMGDRDAMMSDLNRAAALDPRFQAAAAQMAGQLQLPSDKDMLFLFPGEQGSGAVAPAAGGRGRRFGAVAGVSLIGGLLLAFGLLQTVLAPLKEKATALFTRAATAQEEGASAAVDTAQPASVSGLLPGMIRGQYEISRQIGEGGMGTVFEGKDRSLGRRVAIKKMRDEIRSNPRERARFVIEAKTVAALHHPNIVDIYAIAEDGLDVYLVFEYVDGPTVHELIQKAGRLSIPESVGIVRASADALAHAHAHGAIHRDMKPSNVMLDSSGRVKVMDFGIARMAKDAATRYSMTNTVVGTPPYMAPEQEQGHVRRESDVYALAVCAYEMLTGKLPFAGVSAGMLMNKINMSFIAPSRAAAGLPEALDAVFTRAFQADPDNRYRTPHEFADALESALPSAARA